jgi:ATP-dependent RNA helicase DHX36
MCLLLQENIKLAIKRLQAIQALSTATQTLSKEDSKLLTPLGSHLSRFPCPAAVGKLLIYGAILSCAAPLSAIAACISSRDPFLTASGPDAENTKTAVRSAKLRSYFTAISAKLGH